MVGKSTNTGKNPPSEPDQEDLKAQLLMREVEEEVRREQLAKLWASYGTYMLAAAAAVIVVIAGWQYARQRAQAAVEATGASYVDAVRLVEAGKTDEAIKALDVIAGSGAAGYPALARLQIAAAHQKAGRKAEALAAFEELAKDQSSSAVLADFAQLQAAALRLDSADWTEMQNRLNGLAAESSAWRFGARELLGLAALKAGRLEDARKTFQELLADPKVPPSIGQRAQIVMGQVAALELQAGAAPGSTPPASPATGPTKP